MNYVQAADHFAQWMKAKRLAESTIKSYRSQIMLFGAHVSKKRIASVPSPMSIALHN